MYATYVHILYVCICILHTYVYIRNILAGVGDISPKFQVPSFNVVEHVYGTRITQLHVNRFSLKTKSRNICKFDVVPACFLMWKPVRKPVFSCPLCMCLETCSLPSFNGLLFSHLVRIIRIYVLHILYILHTPDTECWRP